MKTTAINKIIQLADQLDSLGFHKEADTLDLLRAKFANDEVRELVELFDEPLQPDEEEDLDLPSVSDLGKTTDDSESTMLDDEAPAKPEYNPGESRLDAIKRRHELMKLKELLEKEDEEDSVEEVEQELAKEEVEDALSTSEPSFEDESLEDDEELDDDEEDSEDDESEADDGVLDMLKDKLKEMPGVAKKLLTILKNNPELLELLAL